jgi:BlaI family transcriptional regulator, penicillinase repressor
MPPKKNPQDLGRRERQILDVIFRLGEASVGSVLQHMPDPPAYDSVRTMIRLLERKGFLRHRREGTKYVYRPTQSQESASRSALSHLMNTFFRGSAAETMAAIFDVSSDDLTDQELERLEQLIEQARKEGR